MSYVKAVNVIDNVFRYIDFFGSSISVDAYPIRVTVYPKAWTYRYHISIEEEGRLWLSGDTEVKSLLRLIREDEDYYLLSKLVHLTSMQTTLTLSKYLVSDASKEQKIVRVLKSLYLSMIMRATKSGDVGMISYELNSILPIVEKLVERNNSEKVRKYYEKLKELAKPHVLKSKVISNRLEL